MAQSGLENVPIAKTRKAQKRQAPVFEGIGVDGGSLHGRLLGYGIRNRFPWQVELGQKRVAVRESRFGIEERLDFAAAIIAKIEGWDVEIEWDHAVIVTNFGASRHDAPEKHRWIGKTVCESLAATVGEVESEPAW